jgi:hypothetical protein
MMKRFLFVIIAASLFFLPVHTVIPTAFAQVSPTPTTTSTPAPTPTPASRASPGDWVQDPMVTFLGKAANRAEDFMDWTLVNYKWDYLDTSLMTIWKAIRNIVYALFILAILVTAFLIIINGGRRVGILIFTRKFIFALLFVTFSFAIARFLYQLADIFQVFFLQAAGTANGIITGKDIVNISFASPDFQGFRITGIGFDESAFISLLLIQVSSVTFYVIGFILTVRKIILWFFLASSPLYPIVLLYEPMKRTAKIWMSEFLRWLLYAPLFALFLSAVVIIWKSNLLILPFNFSSIPPLYPTAISILVGGPGQQLSLTNSMNGTDTYVQYVIALIMLWVAILMPFILLQILLDFLAKYEFGDSPMFGYINALQNNVMNTGFPFLKKPPEPSPLPTGQFPAGLAREIPRHVTTQEETSIKRTVTTVPEQHAARQQAEQTSYTQAGNVVRQQQTTNQNQQTNITNVTENKQQTTQVTQQPVVTVQFKPEVLARPTTRLISFPIPTMRDIASFETARLSRAEVRTHQLQQTQETLGKIADPKTSATPQEAQHFTTLREQLTQEKTKGDVLAKSILSAASTVQKPRVAKPGETGVPSAVQTLPVITLPVVNQIQTVSFDDYEAVKALWLENYQHIDVPAKYSNRRSWIEDDGEAVSQVMTLLSSPDPMKVREGLASVSNILPFLLIGGFSQTEVIAYLKAKGAAGKGALEELAKQEENQETLLKVGAKKATLKELQEEVTLDEKDKNK